MFTPAVRPRLSWLGKVRRDSHFEIEQRGAGWPMNTIMEESRNPSVSDTPWYLHLARWLCLPLILLTVPLVLLLLGCLAMYAYSVIWISEFQFRRLMRRRGRMIGIEHLRERMAIGGNGTFIIEWPTIGWSHFRVWWIEDASTPQRPVVSPGTQHPERDISMCRDASTDGLVLRDSLHHEMGSALLVRMGSIRDPKSYLNREFPHARLIDVHTSQVDVSVAVTAGRRDQ